MAQIHSRDDQLAGFTIGEGLQEDRIGDAEDGGAGSYAEGDGEHGDGGEQGIPCQDAAGHDEGAEDHGDLEIGWESLRPGRG